MSRTPETSRREFLRQTSAATVGLSALNLRSLVRGESPNEKIRIGVIGTGVRGKYLIGNLPENVAVVAICDSSTSRMAETLNPQKAYAKILSAFQDNDAPRCQQYQDYRELIDQEQIDAVIIATPDHHHVQAAMLALEAGLDVYLEKPLTVTIREGRILADKVKETGSVLQVGSQQRTMEINQFACEFVRDGGLGKISKVELPNYPGPISEPQFPEEPIPESLDWDLFLGPTPLRSHNRKLWVKDVFKVGNLMWRGWDLFEDYSGHLMTNWGAHSVDMVQYALGTDGTGPVSINAYKAEAIEKLGQEWGHKSPLPVSADDRRYWPVRMKYADGVEVHFTGGNGAAIFYGEHGSMKIRRNFYEIDQPDLIKNGIDLKAATEKWQGEGIVARPHLENWLDCIRSREQPNAPVEVGHRSISVCHLANLARKLKRPLDWNPELEQFKNDSAANELLDRPRREGWEL